MTPGKGYPESFVAVMGFNTDGKLQAKLWRRIFPAVEKVRFFVNQIMAQIIHDQVSWEPGHSREESDWFAAEKVLLPTYGFDGFLDITIRSFLLEAARIIRLCHPAFPDLSSIIVARSDGFFVPGKKFLNYLNAIASSGMGIWLIFQAASEEAEINFESVERCMRLELEELFRQKEREGYQFFGG
jgi:hypothetical protein